MGRLVGSRVRHTVLTHLCFLGRSHCSVITYVRSLKHSAHAWLLAVQCVRVPPTLRYRCARCGRAPASGGVTSACDVAHLANYHQVARHVGAGRALFSLRRNAGVGWNAVWISGLYRRERLPWERAAALKPVVARSLCSALSPCCWKGEFTECLRKQMLSAAY